MSSKDLKIRFESQFCRMNCQMFSWLLSSGAPRQRQKRDVAWAGWVGSAAVEQVDLMLITSGYRRASACGTLSMPFCALNRCSCYAPAMGLHLITICYFDNNVIGSRLALCYRRRAML